MARRCRRAGCARSSWKRSREPVGDLGHGQRLGAGGGQLDGQRQTVEVAAQLDELGVDRLRPAGRANIGCTARARSTNSSADSSSPSGPSGDLALALDAERLAAGRHDAQPPGSRRAARARTSPPPPATCSQLSRTTTHRVALAEALDGPLLGRRRRLGRRPARAPARRSPTAMASATAAGRATGASSTNHTSPRSASRRGELEGEPGLADAAGTDDRRQPRRRPRRRRARPARRWRPTNEVSGVGTTGSLAPRSGSA